MLQLCRWQLRLCSVLSGSSHVMTAIREWFRSSFHQHLCISWNRWLVYTKNINITVIIALPMCIFSHETPLRLAAVGAASNCYSNTVLSASSSFPSTVLMFKKYSNNNTVAVWSPTIYLNGAEYTQAALWCEYSYNVWLMTQSTGYPSPHLFRAQKNASFYVLRLFWVSIFP